MICSDLVIAGAGLWFTRSASSAVGLVVGNSQRYNPILMRHSHSLCLLAQKHSNRRHFIPLIVITLSMNLLGI